MIQDQKGYLVIITGCEQPEHLQYNNSVAVLKSLHLAQSVCLGHPVHSCDDPPLHFRPDWISQFQEKHEVVKYHALKEDEDVDKDVLKEMKNKALMHPADKGRLDKLLKKPKDELREALILDEEAFHNLKKQGMKFLHKADAENGAGRVLALELPGPGGHSPKMVKTSSCVA